MSSHAARQRRYRERLKAKRDGDAVTPVTVSDAASPVTETPPSPVTQELEALRAQLDTSTAMLEEMAPFLDELKELRAHHQAILALWDGAYAESEQMKARLAEFAALDAAVAPFRDAIRRFGFTEPQAVQQLFQWQMALAGPDKVRAFRALAQSHGVPLEELVPPAPAPMPAPIPEPVQTPVNGHGAPEFQATAPQQPVTWDDMRVALEPILHENKRLAAQAARRAGTSMKPASPDAIAAASQRDKEESWAPSRDDTPRDSIRKAFAELRSR